MMSMNAETERKLPGLVASTGKVYSHCIEDSRLYERVTATYEDQSGSRDSIRKENDSHRETNYFKSAEWSPDGTCLISSNADNCIRTFVLPPDLLDDRSTGISLSPYTAHKHPGSINCLTAYPHFELSDPSTTLYLSTPTALPIRLTNVLSPSSAPLASYPLVSPTTELYHTPASIIWPHPGTHFFTGTDCLIALFDISRNGEGPVTRMPTIPSKRHKMKGGGVGMRGIISSMSLQTSSGAENLENGAGMLAAGTWTRCIGLYDLGGMGGTIATWNIAEAADTHAGIGGTGITQVVWSPCSKYLLVAERKTHGVLVYDIRNTSKLVQWLEGRQADTNQRLGIDLFQGNFGTEVWAGGSDGVVRVWEEVGMREGAAESSWNWQASTDPVTSTIVHRTGSVVATSSGQRNLPFTGYYDDISDDDDEDEDEDIDKNKDDAETVFKASSNYKKRTPENIIKVWNL